MSKVPITPENEGKCICPGCPTFLANDCPKEKNERLYCGKGKSACELPEKGCICGNCPVWDEYSLANGYFCLHGQAE